MNERINVLHFISSSFLLARTTIAKKPIQTQFILYFNAKACCTTKFNERLFFIFNRGNKKYMNTECNKSISRRSSRIIDVQVPSAK